MTQEKIAQDIEKFKTDHLKSIKEMMYQNGGLNPIISVLTYDLKTEKVGIIVVPVIGDFQDSAKDFLADKFIPALFMQMKQIHLKPICFSFSSEVWIRVMEVGVAEIPEDWKKLEKIEALMTTFETAEFSEIHCSTMHKTGKTINVDGELVDQIELREYPMGNKKEPSGLEGRFTNIFKRYASI